MRKRSLFNGAGLCSLAVAIAVIVGWAAVVSADTNYWSLTVQALTVFENAQQPVRGQASQRRIRNSVDGFHTPLNTAATLSAKPLFFPSDLDAVEEVLRTLSTQRSLLQSAIEWAEADDDATVKGVVVNQSAARVMADKQKQVDQQFLARIDEILKMVRQDLGAKGAF
jgi:hypothetical protein